MQLTLLICNRTIRFLTDFYLLVGDWARLHTMRLSRADAAVPGWAWPR